MNYMCDICVREFTSKIIFDKHVIYCKVLVDTKNIPNEPSEKKYTDVQQDKLIRWLILQNHHLQKQVNTLNNKFRTIDRKKQIKISVWLNGNIRPAVGWKEFVKQEFHVQESHFKMALEGSLADGIQACLEKNLLKHNNESTNSIIPLVGFRQKQNTLYVYEDNTWKIIERESFITSIQFLVFRIQQYYFQWRMANQSLLESSDEWKNRDMDYGRKMMGVDTSHHTSMGKLYGVTYDVIKRDFEEVAMADESAYD